MRMNQARILAVAALAVLVVLPACKKSDPPAPAPTPTVVTPTVAPEPMEDDAPPAGEWEVDEAPQTFLTPEEINSRNLLRTVYFDYDRSEIRPDQRATLQANATFLRDNADVRILIEGHCDERGTREYNQALGDRRAQAARDYLISLGIPANRIEIISYGEERPVAQGSDAQAWALNRRGEFVAIATGATTDG